MTVHPDLTLRREGAVARLAVNRPDRLNAYTPATADALRGALAMLEADTAVHAVVLTGEGRAFGAGFDLSLLDRPDPPALGPVLRDHFNPLVAAMRASRLPIVAAVNGPCAGAAVGLALAADIVVMGEGAFFLEPFTGLGLVPDAGNSLFLTALGGRVRAAGMTMLGDRVPAAMALAWGLAWSVVPDAALDTEAMALAARLAERAPAAIAATKALIRGASDGLLATVLEQEAEAQDRLGRSAETAEAVRAFTAKRR
jgi:2-(1,2-epoxy-1,2-dihydrophenyl)acetyl-CoA isomerase